MKLAKSYKKYQLGLFYILINSLLWGVSPYIIKIGFLIIPPFAFLFYRFIWVTLYKLLESVVKQRPVNTFKTFFQNPTMIISAIFFNFVTLVFYFKGLELVTPLQGGVLAGTAPLFVILPMLLFKKEKFTFKEVLGIFIMVLGYIFLLLGKNGGSDHMINWLGVFYITVGNAINAIAIIINKKYLSESNRIEYEFISSLFALIGFGCLLAWFSPNLLSFHSIVSGMFNWSVLYMAIFGTIVALTFFNKSMIYLEASEAISFVYSQPFFLAILELFLKLRRLDINFLIGTFILLSGIIFNILGIIKEHEQ